MDKCLPEKFKLGNYYQVPSENFRWPVMNRCQVVREIEVILRATQLPRWEREVLLLKRITTNDWLQENMTFIILYLPNNKTSLVGEGGLKPQ